MAMQADGNEPRSTAGVINADDTSPKTDVVGGAGDCQSSCDWSQDLGDDPKMDVGGAGDGQSSCDWSVDSHRMKMIGGEDLSQGIEADDERGDSSSDEDDDWQEVEGQCDICYVKIVVMYLSVYLHLQTRGNSTVVRRDSCTQKFCIGFTSQT